MADFLLFLIIASKTHTYNHIEKNSSSFSEITKNHSSINGRCWNSIPQLYEHFILANAALSFVCSESWNSILFALNYYCAHVRVCLVYAQFLNRTDLPK